MLKKIVIAGGTGFVGRYLTAEFSKLGHEVIIISRSTQHTSWEDIPGIVCALENSGLLINLAGKSVDCRYNPGNKREILLSRTGTTRILGKAILQCINPPELWINSSTATIYRHAEDRPMTEKNGEFGTGFSVNVARSWEKSFFDFKLPATRQVAMRMAIVLGKSGGVVTPFSNLVRYGLGGHQGKGNQMFSWIHVDDLLNIIIYFQKNRNLTGVVNCSAPNPVSNKILMHTFRKLMHRKVGLPAPRWLLEIGAAIIKTETELILKSRWVLPGKLLEAGFIFKYPEIKEALANIIDGK